MYNCNICGCQKFNRFAVKERMLNQGNTFEYTQCKKCGTLHLVDGQVDNIGSFYQNNYYSYAGESTRKNGFSMYMKRVVICLLVHLHLPTRITQSLANRIPGYIVCLNGVNINKRSKILDVGCGSGGWLDQLDRCGYKNLFGLDAYCSDSVSPDFEVIKTDILDKRIDEKGPFDLISFHHSFEHMNNPHEVLKRTKELLKSSGRIIVRIPIGGGIAWDEYGVNWYQIDAPWHYYIYTEKSFCYLCKDVGLDVARMVYDSLPSQFLYSEKYKSTELSLADIEKDTVVPKRYYKENSQSECAT